MKEKDSNDGRLKICFLLWETGNHMSWRIITGKDERCSFGQIYFCGEAEKGETLWLFGNASNIL